MRDAGPVPTSQVLFLSIILMNERAESHLISSTIWGHRLFTLENETTSVVAFIPMDRQTDTRTDEWVVMNSRETIHSFIHRFKRMLVVCCPLLLLLLLLLVYSTLLPLPDLFPFHSGSSCCLSQTNKSRSPPRECGGQTMTSSSPSPLSSVSWWLDPHPLSRQ